MAELLRRTWLPRTDAIALPRRDRRACSYAAYSPDTLRNRNFSFDGQTAADIDDGALAVAALDRQALSLSGSEALARLLLRAESVASSKIEGLEVGARRLLRFEAGSTDRDATAAEVVANIDAMAVSVGRIDPDHAITLETILDAHRRILEPSGAAAYGGKLRAEQNWIGGSSFNPCSAAFVPPPPDLVPTLLQDLITFANGDDLPTVAQAAIAHAQFETIHPFVDGNGRVGRALIHMIFRRRGLTLNVSPPTSLVLATRAADYIAGLEATRYVGAPESRRAFEGVNRWVATFAVATLQAVRDAEHFERRIADIRLDWRRRLGAIRAESALDRLVNRLPGQPILTVEAASLLIDRSFQATNLAIATLQDGNILRLVTAGKNRNRVFEARAIVDAFSDFERRLATPGGDTLVAKPARAVPYRIR